jgi:uncharacterized protein YndB with AHSA1/START domain
MMLFLVVLLIVSAWSLFRAGTPVNAFRRQIIVNVPREVAWEYFSRPKQWASWVGAGAPTEVRPSDVVGPDTIARFGKSFEFRMKVFAPPDHWMWSARIGWFTLDYDHVFERLADRQTRMVFHQTVTGFGSDVLANAIGIASRLGGHQAALDKLADEINHLTLSLP